MNNKKTYIVIGIITFAVFVILSIVAMVLFTSINFKLILLMFFTALILLELSVMFLTKAGIIPKWAKYVAFGYFIFAVLVFTLALFCGLGHVL